MWQSLIDVWHIVVIEQNRLWRAKVMCIRLKYHIVAALD